MQLRPLLALTLCVLLAACASEPSVPSASKEGGAYKIGKPYQIKGTWYYPHEDYAYDETGIASWYGAENDGLPTSNGEIFSKNELTAAHKTLPLPTLARVTNLENGRSIVVRINDRGPFAGTRIIDLSQRAAQLLGFEGVGTAKVRVQVLADESKAIADAMRHYGRSAPVETASAVQSAAMPASVESQNLDAIRTTPEIHRQLLETKPVAQAIQLPVVGATRLYIQAGAFSVQGNAQRLKESLSSLSETSITQVQIGGKTFYRVRLGPVASVAQADSLLTKVRQAGVPTARTVVD